MKYIFLLLLAISSTMVKAQQSPRDEYTDFAKFSNYDQFDEYVAAHVKKSENIANDANGIIMITVLIDSAGNVDIPECLIRIFRALCCNGLCKQLR